MKPKKLKIQKKSKQLKPKKLKSKLIKKIKPFKEMNEKEIKQKINQLLNNFKEFKEKAKKNEIKPRKKQTKELRRKKKKKEIKKIITKLITKLEEKNKIKINPIVKQNLLNYYYSKSVNFKLIKNILGDLKRKIKYLEKNFLIETFLMKNPIYYYQWILARPLSEIKTKTNELIKLAERMKLIEFGRELNAIKSTETLKAKKDLEIIENIKVIKELKNLLGFDIYIKNQRNAKSFEKTQIAKLINITTRKLSPLKVKEIIKKELNKIKEKLNKNKPMLKEEKEFLTELIYYNNLKLKEQLKNINKLIKQNKKI